jgi:hypothetical protein
MVKVMDTISSVTSTNMTNTVAKHLGAIPSQNNKLPTSFYEKQAIPLLQSIA